MFNHILIADECNFYRKGLLATLRTCLTSFQVSETPSGKEALKWLQHAEPTLVISNIELLEMDGIEMVRTLQKIGIRHHRFVFITEKHWLNHTFCRFAPHYLYCLFESGIKHISSKEELDDRSLEDMLRAVSRGNEYLSPIVRESFNFKYEPDLMINSKLKLLTQKEKDFLMQFAQHKPASEIAEAMHISKNTMNTHREHVLTKFGLRTVDELRKFCSSYMLMKIN